MERIRFVDALCVYLQEDEYWRWDGDSFPYLSILFLQTDLHRLGISIKDNMSIVLQSNTTKWKVFNKDSYL
jgi:hypothetical protein